MRESGEGGRGRERGDSEGGEGERGRGREEERDRRRERERGREEERDRRGREREENNINMYTPNLSVIGCLKNFIKLTTCVLLCVQEPPPIDAWTVCTKCETYRPPRSHHCK